MTRVRARPSTTIAPARRCAYTVLRRVFERGAYADRALRAEAGTLDRRDRALAARLSYGSVQRRGTLDHLIALLAAREIGRLDAPVLAALRLGAYELLYLGGSPDYAVVADAVQLSKQHGRAGHGLVNAVLRRAAREGPALLGALSDETPEQAAIKHSHPEWIARLWWRELGAAHARALMAHDNEPAELALRANTLLMDAPELAARLAGASGEGPHGGPPGDGPPGGDPSRRRGTAGTVSCHLDPQIPEAVVLDSPLDVHGSALWRAGAFVAQSRAAMLVARALAPRAGERVLDLCAAPGGKTTHLAALMEGQGEVVAVERNRSRAAALVRTALRLHAGNVRVEVRDAAIARPGGPGFDRVLVDPPCSGLGTLQARADLRWRATPASAAEMSRLQGAILAAGGRALRPGGVLVYSTCTISANENEHVIAAFLDSHRDFSLDDLAAELPAFALPPSPWPRDREADRQPGREPDRGASSAAPSRPSSPPAAPGAVLTLPHRDRTAGFFIARLRRG
jgi:16S rRNA (cytosine967-C5)-methyltransferase